MKKLLALVFVGMIGASSLCVADTEPKNDKIKNAMVEALQEVLKEREKLVFEKKDDKLVVSHYDKNSDFTVNIWENKFPIAVGALVFIIATPLFYKFFKGKMFRGENSSDVLGDMSALVCTMAASGCSSYIISKLGKEFLKLMDKMGEKSQKEICEKREEKEELIEKLDYDLGEDLVEDLGEDLGEDLVEDLVEDLGEELVEDLGEDLGVDPEDDYIIDNE